MSFYFCKKGGEKDGQRRQARCLSGLQERKFDKPQLKKYIEAGPSTPPWVGSSEEAIGGPDAKSAKVPEEDVKPPTVQPPAAPHLPSTEPEELRVFISHGSNMEVVEQIQTMLQIADIESEVAVKEETSAIPVPEKVFGAMRRCRAGIIVVSVDETRKDKAGSYAINENVLIEIGAAFVLYEKRVVLLWDKRLKVPSNLQGLYRCEFEGDELSWSAGMKLMKAIRGFKNPEPS